MKLKELINKGVETISVLYPEREAREMVFRFMEAHVGTKRHTHIMDPQYEVDELKAASAILAFERMASGEPLQYVTGKADFYGREFTVTPDVLIPRPETEIMCRKVIDMFTGRQDCGNGMKILDLCTGSGCIAWTLALEMSGSDVTAVDISDGALSVASVQDFSEEMSRTGAKPPVFLKADVLSDEILDVCPDDTFDVVVSNPPYVMESEKALMRRNVLEHEPSLALFVPDDDPLVFYRAVARIAWKVLKQNGLCVVEINEALGEETAEVFRCVGFSGVEVVKDLNMRDRFVCAIR